MKQFFRKLRLKWFITKNTLGYTSDYLDRLYKIYLNHNKVIHFRNGYPVYSLSTPALYSKPGANFFAHQFYKSITNKSCPNLMSFAVTDSCNANCKHCSFFAGIDKIKKEILTLAQSRKLIRDAQELGVSVINFTGGEPLMREDLPEIINSVNRDLSTTILFTNGWFLGERINELKKAGLDSIFVSIDSASPEKHNAFRGMENLFNKAIEGLEKAIKSGFSTGISCCLTPETFKEGEFKKIIELGKKIGVHEILFYDAMPTGRYHDRKDLIGNSGTRQDFWTDEMIQSAKPYNDDMNYPGILVYTYTTSYRSIGCACGVSYFYVTPYGDICLCDFNHVIFGNILETPLYQIWDKITSMNDFKSVSWGECKLKDPKWQDKKTVSNEFCVFTE